MSTSEPLNIDSLVLDPFVAKFHLIRDIGQSSLQTLFLGCTRAFGEENIKQLLITHCMQQLQGVANVNRDECSSTLRDSLIRHHEKFDPSNPALLHILPTTVLSKCFSYVDIHTLLCSVELVCRNWFHVARLASSITDFPATANIAPSEQPYKLKRLTHATTLNYSQMFSVYEIDLLQNMDVMTHINRLYVHGILPQFITKCPDTFLNQLVNIEINYSSTTIGSDFWKAFHGNCRENLSILRLQNILISKQTYSALNKFISHCKNLREFACHRWRFADANTTINATLKALSEHCRNLKSLRIEYCRTNDKAMVHITKLMEYKLRRLAIIHCNRFKMTTFGEIGRKQQELLSSLKHKALHEFVIDDKMISASIFDHLSGLHALSISADHLSGSIAYSALNRYKSLQRVCIQFRSSIDRLNSHSSSMFNWKLFFEQLGETLVSFECNCQVIQQQNYKKQKAMSTPTTTGNSPSISFNVSNLKLFSKEHYENFMVLDFNIFIYIATYCKRLKILKMSGWKFDATQARLDLDGLNEIDLDAVPDDIKDVHRPKTMRKSGRSNSLYFVDGSLRTKNHQKMRTELSLNRARSNNKGSKFQFGDVAMKWKKSAVEVSHSQSRPTSSKYSSSSHTMHQRVNSKNERKSKSPNIGAMAAPNSSNADSSAAAESVLTMENLIMIPISNLLQSSTTTTEKLNYKHEILEEQQLDYMKLEWMFDFGDIPSLNTLNFWCDTVLGLNCQMSITEDMKDGSVLILEWNANWTNFIAPTIIHHQSETHAHNNNKSTSLYKSTKQRMRKTKRKKEDLSADVNSV